MPFDPFCPALLYVTHFAHHITSRLEYIYSPFLLRSPCALFPSPKITHFAYHATSRLEYIYISIFYTCPTQKLILIPFFFVHVSSLSYQCWNRIAQCRYHPVECGFFSPQKGEELLIIWSHPLVPLLSLILWILRAPKKKKKRLALNYDNWFFQMLNHPETRCIAFNLQLQTNTDYHQFHWRVKNSRNELNREPSVCHCSLWNPICSGYT